MEATVIKRNIPIKNTETFDIIDQVVKSTGKNRLTLAAAGLAFHGFLAIFPAMIAAVGLAALVGLSPSAFASVVHDLNVLLPRPVAKILVDSLKSSGSKRADFVAVIFGLAVACWSSIEAISALQQALDLAFNIPKDHGLVMRRVKAIPLLGVTVVLGGFSVAILVFGASIERLVVGNLPASLHGIIYVGSWIIRVVGALFAIALLISIYYGAAQGRPWRDWRVISLGGAIATFGWVIVSLGYSIYLTQSHGTSATYGSLTDVAVLLLWLYMTFIVILIGAEFDHAYQLHRSKESDK